MIPLCALLTFLCCHGQFADSAPTAAVTYDKRQEGDVNVQVDVKDIHVVAVVDSDLFEDYLHYDYAYDYSDFTIKPSSKPTTACPTAPNSTMSSTSEMTSSTTEQNMTTVSPSTTSMSSSSSATETTTTQVTTTNPVKHLFSTMKNDFYTTIREDEIVSTNSEFGISDVTTSSTDITSVNVIMKEKNVTESSTIHDPAMEKRQVKKCPAGFVTSKSRRCRRRRIALIPWAMRIAPKLTGSATNL